MNYLNAVLDIAGYRWRLRYVSLLTPLPKFRKNYVLRGTRWPAEAPLDKPLRLEQDMPFAYHDSTPDEPMTLPCFTFDGLTAHETTELLCQVREQIGDPDVV